MDTKPCVICGKPYARKWGKAQWEKAQTCSRACSLAKGRMTRPWPSLSERFWAKVDKTPGQGPLGDCHEWQGHRMKWGYGVVRVKSKIKKAHRVAYELSNGEIPGKLFVKHSCDNPPCCNPNHLSVGDHLSNMQEMEKAGRRRHRGDGLLPRVVPGDRDSMPIPGKYATGH